MGTKNFGGMDAPQDFSLLLGVPLLALSALEGRALGGSVAVPFLMDVEVHMRFLVALPLLIVGEPVVHQQMRLVVRQFLERNLIPEAAMPRFEVAIASAFRLRNSVLPEVLLLAIVYYHASRSRRRSGISFRHGRRIHCPRVGARRAGCGTTQHDVSGRTPEKGVPLIVLGSSEF